VKLLKHKLPLLAPTPLQNKFCSVSLQDSEWITYFPSTLKLSWRVISAYTFGVNIFKQIKIHIIIIVSGIFILVLLLICLYLTILSFIPFFFLIWFQSWRCKKNVIAFSFSRLFYWLINTCFKWLKIFECSWVVY